MSDSGNPYAAPEHDAAPQGPKSPAELLAIRRTQRRNEALVRGAGIISIAAAVTGSLSVVQVLQQEVVLGKAQLVVGALVGFAWLVAGVWLVMLDAKGRVLYCLLAAIACIQMGVTMWTEGRWGLLVAVGVLVGTSLWLASGRAKVVLGRYYRRVVVPATREPGGVLPYVVPTILITLFVSIMVLDLAGLLP